MKCIYKLMLVIAVPIISVSCADEYDCSSTYDKPEEVALADYLNGYDVLKTYINRSVSPDFKLGMGLAVNEFTEKEVKYSIARTNFDEITATDGMTHGSIVSDDGTMAFRPVMNFVSNAKDAQIAVHGRALCWHSMQNNAYLNEIIAPIPGDLTTGKTVVADFEANNINDAYPMSGNTGTATVVADPAGKSGNVLRVLNAVYDSYPKIHITLPKGKTLGNYKRVVLDINAPGTGGYYGNGMRMAINDTPLAAYGSPSSFPGCPGGGWGRGCIVLELDNLNLTAAYKALTEFDLIVGSRTGKSDYYIDNITMFWEIGKDDYIRPDAEKKEILTGAMNKWIAGMMEACDGYVTAWDVINEPMSDNENYKLRSAETETNADENFYWQDYLGENYAREIVKSARENFEVYGGEANSLKLFVNEYGLENPGNEKCKRLLQMIKQWEEDGITRIDGIGTAMHVTYSFDPAQQAKNEAGVVAMFGLLKETGKLVRISELEMNATDKNGQEFTAGNLTFVQRLAMGEYYNFIIRKYLEIIPAVQCCGITHWSPMDTLVGLWNGSSERNPAYIGFADGLAGKVVVSEAENN